MAEGTGIECPSTSRVSSRTYSFRERLSPDAILLYDGLWRKSFDQAITVARKLREMDVSFFECPLAPEAIDDHRRLRELIPNSVDSMKKRPLQGRYLSHRDAVQLYEKALIQPGIKFEIVYGSHLTAVNVCSIWRTQKKSSDMFRSIRKKTSISNWMRSQYVRHIWQHLKAVQNGYNTDLGLLFSVIQL